MMTRNPDILFMTEYIKNVLYFATVRQGKILKSTAEAHYFCIDNELVYENYYSDFGPLNLGCVYMYCKLLNEKLKQYLNKQSIVHYTSVDPKKKANAAFLLGCYGVLYLRLTAKDALKPLTIHGQTYPHFQDATQDDSVYTISLLDCLLAIKKAKELGFFNFQDFNFEEYKRLDKIQGGDLNWILPGKFLAFIGPVDYSVSLYHPPEMYIDYFKENNVKVVIRLNKRMYDGNVFNNANILHYDLFFPDGSCPPRHILLKFLQISEEVDGAVAVHCKAGLGRTGSLIGSYLIKHYRMTAREAIGWMRICRPGSVIGHQQAWLEQLEPWLTKQGNLYRKRTFQDIEKFPIHEFGVYSITEKMIKQRPVILSQSPSPLPPVQRPILSNTAPQVRPQPSKVRDEVEVEEEEKFLTSCDLTVNPSAKVTLVKGCLIRNNIFEDNLESESSNHVENISLWRKIILCQPCITSIRHCNDGMWNLAVCCSGIAPERCNSSMCCNLLDRIAPSKTTKKDQRDFRVRSAKLNPSQVLLNSKEDVADATGEQVRRTNGAGKPRPILLNSTSHSASRSGASRTARPQTSRQAANNSDPKPFTTICPPILSYSTTQNPAIKSLSDARKFLLMNSIINSDKVNAYNNQDKPKKSVGSIATPPLGMANVAVEQTRLGNRVSNMNMLPRDLLFNQQRRRLGRSPSPSPLGSPTRVLDRSRATNTTSAEKYNYMGHGSKATIKHDFSKLLSAPRMGSVGAASLGARRDAPAPRVAPSVRSDERPTATQGDMLNSIKFQRRFRETPIAYSKVSGASKDSENATPKISINKSLYGQDCGGAYRSSSKYMAGPQRPSSPKSRVRASPTYN